MKTSTGHKINQPQGPRVGNRGTPEKRDAFMAAKDKSSSERAALADMVTGALANRGRGVEPHTDKALEGIKMDVNVGRGPTRGNAAKKSTSGKRGALGATSGY